MADVNFFQQREPLKTNIEGLMQNILEANRQKMQQQEFQQQLNQAPVGGTVQQGMMEQPNTVGPSQMGLGTNAVQTLQKMLQQQGQPQQQEVSQAGTPDLKTVAFNQEQQKDVAFRDALSRGDINAAYSIDPERLQKLQSGEAQQQALTAKSQLAQDKAGLAKPSLDSSAFQKQIGKDNASLLSTINTEAAQAGDDYSRNQQIAPLFNKIYTGSGGEQVQAIRQALSALNPNWVDPGDAAIGNAIDQFTQQSAVALTVPYKGAISNTELELFRRAVPNLSATPEGNKLMAQFSQAGAARKIEKANFVSAWRQKFKGGDAASDIAQANNAWNSYISNPDNAIIKVDADGKPMVDESNISSWRLFLDNIKDPYQDAVQLKDRQSVKSAPNPRASLRNLQSNNSLIEQKLRDRGLLGDSSPNMGPTGLEGAL